MNRCSYYVLIFLVGLAYANIIAWKHQEILNLKFPNVISRNNDNSSVDVSPLPKPQEQPKHDPSKPPFTPEPKKDVVFENSSLNIDNFAIVLRNPVALAIGASPFQMVIMDTEYVDKKERMSFTAKQIGDLKKNKSILAYLSIGEAEKFRSYWKDSWDGNKPKWIGKESLHWKGVYAIRDVSNDTWEKIVRDRIDDIIAKGYSGVVLAGIPSYKEQLSDKSRTQMINFVIEMSQYAKAKKPGFTVFVMDSEELLANDTYMKAIDGIVKQNLYYSWKTNGSTGPKNSDEDISKSLEFLRKAKRSGKNVLVIEYVQGKPWTEVKDDIRKEGFLGYSAPRQLSSLRINQ